MSVCQRAAAAQLAFHVHVQRVCTCVFIMMMMRVVFQFGFIDFTCMHTPRAFQIRSLPFRTRARSLGWLHFTRRPEKIFYYHRRGWKLSLNFEL